MNEKKCTICGCTYIANSNRQKYCTECKKEIIKKQRDKAREKYYRKMILSLCH